MENEENFIKDLMSDLSEYKEKHLKDTKSIMLVHDIETLITEYKKKRIAAHVYSLNYGEKARKIRNLEKINSYLKEFIIYKGFTSSDVNKFIFEKLGLLEKGEENL